MDIVKKDGPKLKIKLSLTKETLRVLEDADLRVLDAVVGGTGGCTRTSCNRTIIEV